MKQTLLGSILVACALQGVTPVAAQTNEYGSPELIKAATKEGKLVLYTTMDKENTMRAIGLFNKRFPDIDVQVLRMPGGQLVTRVQAEMAAGRPADLFVDCLPLGMPSMMLGATYPFAILQTPGQTTLIAEYFGETRRIYTDGRPHPSAEDLEPTYVGHSIGRWEGQTLLVDTIGLKTNTQLDSSLAPRSDREDQRVTERWRMTGPNTLEIEISFIDPGALTRPWTVVKRYQRAPADDYVREFVCVENNRNARTIGE